MNENAANIRDRPSQHITKNVIHKRLEYGKSVSQPIWHDQVLKVPRCGAESDLPLVYFPDAHKVASTPEVQLGKVAGPPELLNGGGNLREQVLVLHCKGIQTL